MLFVLEISSINYLLTPKYHCLRKKVYTFISVGPNVYSLFFPSVPSLQFGNGCLFFIKILLRFFFIRFWIRSNFLIYIWLYVIPLPRFKQSDFVFTVYGTFSFYLEKDNNHHYTSILH